MKTADVIRYFGTQRNAARALGLSPGAINAWDETVPEYPALRLHVLTDGKLHYNAALYDKLAGRKPIPLEEIFRLQKMRLEVQRERERQTARCGV